MKITDAGLRKHVKKLSTRSVKVHVVHQGEGMIMRREVAPARRKAAFNSILARLKKARPAKAGEQTASELLRELRAGGRY